MEDEMKIIVDESVVNMFPDLAIGIVVAKDVSNQDFAPELRALTMERVKELRTEFAAKNFKEDPRIASWREAYRVQWASAPKNILQLRKPL